MNPFKPLRPSRRKHEEEPAAPSGARTRGKVRDVPASQFVDNRTLSSNWSSKDVFGDLWKKNIRALEDCPTKSILLTTCGELDKVLHECKQAGLMVFDFETTGLDPISHEVVSVQITCEEGKGYYVPIAHRDYEGNFPRETVLRKMHRLMKDPEVTVVGHNLKFDYVWFHKDGFTEVNGLWDTMLAAHIIDENRSQQRLGLKLLAAEKLQYNMITFKSLGIWTKDGPCPEGMKPNFSYLTLEEAMPYACADVDMTLRLYKDFRGEIDDCYSTIFYEIEMPLVPVLARMEFEGVEMDVEYMKTLGVHLKAEIDKLFNYMNDTVLAMPIVKPIKFEVEENDDAPIEDPMGCEQLLESLGDRPTIGRIHADIGECNAFDMVLRDLNRKNWYKRLTKEGKRKRKAGFTYEFNWGSPDHLLKLFSVLGIQTGRLTAASRQKDAKKKKMSTDKKALQSMARQPDHPGHKIAKALLGYRQLTKIHSSFCEKLPGKVHPVTGRIHPDFRQFKVVTGRLSCATPNMQQIPKTGICAIRYPFQPRKGYVFIQCDYSQIELRILAHIAQDWGMIEAFKSGADIHSLTALECFEGNGIPEGTPLELVAKLYDKLRSAAKSISFGIIYGMGSKALAEKLGIEQSEAEKYIKAYLDRKPKVREYMVHQKREMHARGYVSTPLGRRRHIPKMDNGRRPFGWERKAINFPIQSASAEILKHVMAKLVKKFDEMETSARLLLQIHDELIIEVKEEEAAAIKPIVKEIFEAAVEDLGYKYDVPLTAEPAIQARWAIKADECPDCGLYGLIPDGGTRVVKDPESGLDKIEPTKTCCKCNEVKHPGLWDLEETFRTIEADAIMDEAA